MLKLKNISKTFNLKKGKVVHALKNVNLTFENEGMIFLLGKSGSGKSTLLNIIGGLDSCNAGGNLMLDGQSTAEFKQKDFDNYRNRTVGFIFQEFHLLENMTVIQNVLFALDLQGLKHQKNKALEALKSVDLEECVNRRVNEMSGGQKQRAAIARALVKSPKLILADEPTGDLDSQTGEQIFTLLKSLSKDKLIIVVTHDRESALRYGDRVIELSDGEVISDIEINSDTEKGFEESVSLVETN